MADVFVRAARVIDAGGFAAAQRLSWLAAANDLGLPAPPDADFMQRSWERAVMAPPSDRHRTWVAVEMSDGEELIVGAAALAPASDPDLDSDGCVEVLVLTVAPEHRGRGHGSRLLTAALQTAAADGEREAVAWVAGADDNLRRFLEAAGWAADGAYRALATGAPPAEGEAADGRAAELRQVRLGTLLEPSR